ncbi:helix-turn-helix domain-containing protein [Streptomyces sp. ISL-10]|uniref:helix-turn-helix domain-containing protein n=1 Tax=Streptomyces sp. ISL-10 TaxID=2819172 RepID=UPI001BEB673A|nr:helix-turn-helix domain-containing protein [Streptomyces sp. ISL-10]MBT2365233.1 helix-turn-helix domain-containing protein [Streptomyces sp. ISL-10]
MPGKKGKRVNPRAHGNDTVLLQRRLKAFELRKQGRSLRSIAKELGVSYTTVSNDIQKCLDEYLIPAVDSYRRQMLAEVDDQLVRLYGYMETPQYITSPRGDIVRGPDGNPLLDREYYLKIEDRISRQLEIRAKLLGAYAPSQTELTVHQVDSTDLAIADLIAQQKARTALERERFKAGENGSA